MSETRLHLTLVIDPSAKPIHGTVGQEGGDERLFVGWVELAATLDEMLEGVAGARTRRRGPPISGSVESEAREGG